MDINWKTVKKTRGENRFSGKIGISCSECVTLHDVTSQLYDKRDDVNFPIVNFPFLDSNIPSSPAYGVYMSPLIRYSIACNSYQDFLHQSVLLTTKLLIQGFIETRLRSTLKTCFWSLPSFDICMLRYCHEYFSFLDTT